MQSALPPSAPLAVGREGKGHARHSLTELKVASSLLTHIHPYMHTHTHSPPHTRGLGNRWVDIMLHAEENAAVLSASFPKAGL